MLHLTYLIILLPLVGFAVQVAAGRRLGDPVAGWVATAFVGASFVVSFLVALGVIRVMLTIVTRRGYAPFGWLRIAIGAIGLALLMVR